ncbi:MAG: MoaD/ThiS family protein [Desulfosarcinaceae bacterium]|nr:MoaD/ThiS family protein [Desulfosarcinaceae bacterium]
MRIRVRLFAPLDKDRFDERALAVAPGARIADLLKALHISVEEVGILVVNHRDATFDQALRDGDRVTLIPHIGGG